MTGEVEDLLTTAEAAGLLGVSTREVRRKARDGTLPAAAEPNRAAGHGYLFRRTDVEAYRAGGEGTSAGRNIVRPTSVPPEVFDLFERHTAALLGVGELGDKLTANAEATSALTEIIRAQAAEIAALTEELRREREDRKRPWWRRLFGRHKLPEV